MREPVSRRDVLKLGLLGCAGIGASGCGSILYPERIGSPHSGALDWKVVALDTIGLLCFFVPGVIAFVVDFVNGTIYLPAGQCAGEIERQGRGRFVTVDVPRDRLDRATIEQAVSRYAEKAIRLDEGTYRTRALANLDEFWRTPDVDGEISRG